MRTRVRPVVNSMNAARTYLDIGAISRRVRITTYVRRLAASAKALRAK